MGRLNLHRKVLNNMVEKWNKSYELELHAFLGITLEELDELFSNTQGKELRKLVPPLHVCKNMKYIPSTYVWVSGEGIFLREDVPDNTPFDTVFPAPTLSEMLEIIEKNEGSSTCYTLLKLYDAKDLVERIGEYVGNNSCSWEYDRQSEETKRIRNTMEVI